MQNIALVIAAVVGFSAALVPVVIGLAHQHKHDFAGSSEPSSR